MCLHDGTFFSGWMGVGILVRKVLTRFIYFYICISFWPHYLTRFTSKQTTDYKLNTTETH